MANFNLEKMSLEELTALQKNVTKAIATFEKRQRDEALAALDAVAKEHGFKLGDLMGGSKAAKPAAAPKYRHPENSELTWTGRGRKSKWITEALEAGKSLEEFAI